MTGFYRYSSGGGDKASISTVIECFVPRWQAALSIATQITRRCRVFLTRMHDHCILFFVVFFVCLSRSHCGRQSKSGAAAGAAGAVLNVEEALFEGEDEDLDDLDIDEGT